MIEYLFLLAGILLLIKGADWLIDGATMFGKKLGLPSFLIGMTVVAFGTSLPELIISLLALSQNSSDIILGNIIGSNISNILLILGFMALFFPIRISKPTINKDLSFSILVTLFLLIISLVFGYINRLLGIIFILIFFSFFYFRFRYAIKEDFIINIKTKLSIKAILLIIIGSFALFIGGRLIVDNVILISQSLGLSQFLISATVIAIGTSLPEFITSINALRKKEKKVAIGNILGSNIFNILWVLGFISLIKPIIISSAYLLDVILLLVISILFLMLTKIGERNSLNRTKGIILISTYILYLIFLIIRG